jgi:hypothetical protein
VSPAALTTLRVDGRPVCAPFPHDGDQSGCPAAQKRYGHRNEDIVRALPIVLKAVAPLFILVGAVHLVLGVGADVALGANLPTSVLADPVLDSQNRFYGVAFTLYGVLLFVCATDLPRYATVVRCVLWIIFAGGLARVVSLVIKGVPPMPVLLLLTSELLLPPLIHTWLSRELRR